MPDPDLLQSHEAASRWRRHGLGLGLAGAVVLGFCAARDLQPFDSAELVLNAVQGGIGHPPGQPAYVLLGWLITHAVPAPPAASLSSLSALATALVTALALALARRSGAVSAAFATVALATVWLVPGVWDLATRPEVYAPATALLLGALWLDGTASSPRRALGAGLCAGLGASINPVMALSLLPLWLSVQLRRRRAPRGTFWLGGMLGLMPYLYLPWIGAHPGTALVWGAPLAGPALHHFLLGRDYRSWNLDGVEYFRNLARVLHWLVEQRMALWLVLGTLGAVVMRSGLPPSSAVPQSVVRPPEPPTVLWSWLAAAPALAFIALNHPFIPSNPDYAGYLLPSLWLAAAEVAWLLGGLWRGQPRHRWLAAATVIALAGFGASASPLVYRRDRGRDTSSRGLARAVLAQAPANAIVLLESDHLVFPCLVLHEIEGVRPDVVLLNAGWASSSWYWQHLQARYPTLPLVAVPDDAVAMRLPPREARIATLLLHARRPVVAETAVLGSLAGSRPTAGRGCLVEALPPGVPQPAAPEIPRCRQILAAEVARQGGEDSLSEHALATTALTAAQNHWMLGQPQEAWRLLFAGLAADDRRDLPATLPPGPAPSWSARTPLVLPRALVGSDVLLLRLGDLVRAIDPALAVRCYGRSKSPEADAALGGPTPEP